MAVQQELKKENKFIIFTMDEEEYGINISQVLEIVRLENIIPIPHSVEYFMGMIDIRGKVIPVIDFKKKLRLKTEHSQKPEKLIIIEFEGQRIGLAVDKVLSVMDFKQEEIDLGPPAVKSFHTEYILGIGKKSDKFIVLINLINLFDKEEMDQFFHH